MSENPLRVTLYGVRGSHSPTRISSNTIGVNTSCLSAEIGDHTLIFDAGSGIVNLGNEVMANTKNCRTDCVKRLHLFMTHMHIDHIEGFPYFLPIYSQNFDVHFFSPRILHWDLEDALQTLVSPPFFPLDFEELPFYRAFNTIKANQIIYFSKEGYRILPGSETMHDEWLLKISCMRNFLHPKGGSFFYRLETPAGRTLVLAYDTEGFIGGDQRLIQFARDADILMHDAQYTADEYRKNQGYGHSTFTMACEVAKRANVKRLLLTHHDPAHSDEMLLNIEREAQAVFPQTQLARENTSFDL